MRYSLRYPTSLLLAVSVLFGSIVPAVAAPDEGMFTPDKIVTLPLKEKGLKIKPIDLYNPNGVDISDAVIQLSVGCTAEFVSPQGLILTNHHCGFDALVSASSAGKDYGKDGYKADSMKDELPAKDYSIFITNRVEDVTAKIKAGTDSLTGDALAKALADNVKALQTAEQAKVPEGTAIQIRMLNSGFFYYLYETVEIKDIRLVYAPPQMIGFYGGDPDNFEWSRHTGDFTFLRAYVAPDGKSVPYSANNVPFKPKKHLTISLDGLKDNDFVFVMGFPGGTTRYRESQAIEYAKTTNYPFLVDYLTSWSNALKNLGAEDEEKRVALQGEIASLDNARKLYEGRVAALKRSNFAGTRRAEETKLEAWIKGDAKRTAKYGDVLAGLDRISNDFYAFGARDRLLRTFPNVGNAPVYKQIIDAVASVKSNQKLTDKKRAEIVATMKDREPLVEREMIKYFLRAASELPANQRFAAADSTFGGGKTSERRKKEEAFAKLIVDSDAFDSAEKISALYDLSWSDLQAKYPDVARIASAQADERAAFAVRGNKFNGEIENLRLRYQQAMAEMKGVSPYPDANSTMRFTYGNVRGYQPREAVQYTPFTTLKGVIEKDTGVFPFDVPQKLKTLQQDKDFGRFGVGDSVPVNFLATTDIIGGNSGSPIMNAWGEQVGIIFDGNYEGTGNDMFVDPNYDRSIAVDIRFVLFVTEKFAGAGWILNEMTLKGGAKVKKAKA
ncbi:MAG: S46 family peptidase [Acidobacteria bacterium]|nr:S46 family peptidase [Acidobacteriota bacterium]